MARPTLSDRESLRDLAATSNLRDSALTLSILDRALARYGPRDFAIRLWDGTAVPADPGLETKFTLVLNTPYVLRRMLLPPNELTLAETYLDKDWDVEGDVLAAMRLGDVFEELALGLGDIIGLARQVMMLPKEPHHDGRTEDGTPARPPELRGTEHSKQRDRKAVTYHYDKGNGFFKLFLDKRMLYSCAYFRTGEQSLDDAQEAKLEHLCRKLRLRPGERLLDIGCGWGALIMFAAERFGVDATGITLSHPQAELANRKIAEAGLADRCRAVVLDYRDLTRFDRFDKIVSVGMVEHVGRPRLPDYFRVAYDSLEAGGVFLNHGITAAAGKNATGLMDRYLFHRGAFVRKYIFPDGELIPLGDTLGIAERAGFEVRDVESLREHYALTLEHWVRRLEANQEEARSLVSERGYRMWRLYLAGCSHAFMTARLSIHQSLLSKPDIGGRSDLPWTRADLYPARAA